MFVGLIVLVMAAAGGIYYFHRSRPAQRTATADTETPDARNVLPQTGPEKAGPPPQVRETSLGSAHQKGVDLAHRVQARQAEGMDAAETIHPTTRPPGATAGAKTETTQALHAGSVRPASQEAAQAAFEARIDARQALAPSRAQLTIREPAPSQTPQPPRLPNAPSPTASALESPLATAPAVPVEEAKPLPPVPVAPPKPAAPTARALPPTPVAPAARAQAQTAAATKRTVPPEAPVPSPRPPSRPLPRPAPDPVRRAYRLTGIFGTSSGYSALLNSRVVRTGQTVGSATVGKVAEDHIELEIDGAVYVLDMAPPKK